MSVRKVATIADVAREAGVSRQTVSNVLNSPAIVRESTRERVRAVIEALGYSPNTVARNLRTRRTSTIGVRLDAYSGGISGVVLDRFVHALTEQAAARGLRVLLYVARTLDEELERIDELADGAEVDAVVLTGTNREDRRTERLAARDVPFVAFGRPWGAADVERAGHPWVDVDGASGVRNATRHLLAEAGERIAFLGWPPDAGTGDDRERGWQDAVGDRAGTASAPRLFSVDGVAEAQVQAQALLVETEVDAIVCASDALAIGARLASVAAGRPDLPIVGFDNTAAAEALGVSSIEQMPEKIVAAILDMLTVPDGPAVIRQSEPEGRLIEPRLVWR